MNARGPFFYSFISVFLILSLFVSFLRTGQAMTTEEEKKLGKAVLEEMLKRLDVVRDLPLQSFINRVGRSLVSQVGPVPFEFDFYLIKGNDPNAFAIPGGHIFVTTGLIALAESEPEVAGVISHEIAHITGRHVAQMFERAKRLSFVTLAAMIAGAIAGRGGKTSEAITTTAMASAEALMLKYTRDNETDADQNSLHYMTRAGYDPQALTSFLKRMDRYSLAMAPKLPQYLSTHPALDSRTALLENLLSLGPETFHPFPGKGNYKRVQNRAFIVERDPSTGVSHFEAQVKASPQDQDALLGLGLAYQKAGRPDKSIEVLQTASRVDPGDEDLLRELGVAYFLSGKMEHAIEVLQSLSEKDDPQSLYFLGKAYQEKGLPDQALSAFQKVQKRVPDFPDNYYNLGSVYGRMGQKGLSHFSFGRYFEMKGERNTALLHYRTALDFLERGSPERTEAQQRVRELTQAK